jgi:hypothetical protein
MTGKFLTAIALVLLSHPAGAQQAELMAVKKGVFTLKVGQSMDLTDRGILLHLNRVNVSNGRATGAAFTINGGGGAYSVGVRRNLKQERPTMDFVKDLRNCFLDFVNAEAPVGAPPSATFRLLCE